MKTAEAERLNWGSSNNNSDEHKALNSHDKTLSGNRRIKAAILVDYSKYLSQGHSVSKTLEMIKTNKPHQDESSQEFIDSIVQMYESHSYKTEIEKFPQNYSKYITEDIEIYYALFKGVPTEKISRHLKSKNILSDAEQLLAKMLFLLSMGCTVDQTFSIILLSEQNVEYRGIIKSRKPHKQLNPAMFNKTFSEDANRIFVNIANCVNYERPLPSLGELIN